MEQSLSSFTSHTISGRDVLIGSIPYFLRTMQLLFLPLTSMITQMEQCLHRVPLLCPQKQKFCVAPILFPGLFHDDFFFTYLHLLLTGPSVSRTSQICVRTSLVFPYIPNYKRHMTKASTILPCVFLLCFQYSNMMNVQNSQLMEQPAGAK